MKEIKTFDIDVVYNTKFNEYRMFIYSYLTDEYFLLIDENSIHISKSQYFYETEKSKINQIVSSATLILNCEHILEVINYA